MSDYISVATHPGLLVNAYADNDDCVRLTYIGDTNVLVAAGLATADVLAPRKKPGAPRGPRPRTGPEWCRVDRYWAVRDGVPIRRCRLFLRRSRQNAMRLPGAVEALEAAERREAAREIERREWEHRDLLAALAREREAEAAEPNDQVPADRARPRAATLH